MAVKSYIVRIYRQDEAEPERVIGLVEHPECGAVERFHRLAELIAILLAPMRSADVVVPQGKREEVSAGR